jgi:hypothetical protein
MDRCRICTDKASEIDAGNGSVDSGIGLDRSLTRPYRAGIQLKALVRSAAQGDTPGEAQIRIRGPTAAEIRLPSMQ